MYIVYRVLSIYRFLPGFREIAFFEKSKRFFILFLDGRYREGVRALARAQIIYRYILYIYINSGGGGGGGATRFFPIYANFFRSPPRIPKIGIGKNREKSEKTKK